MTHELMRRCAKSIPLAAAIASLLVCAAPAGAAHAQVRAAHRAHVTGRIAAHPLTARRGAVAPGTRLGGNTLVGTRVFSDARDGFALASDRSATYPVSTADGGRSWRVDGPQLHVDAADAPEAVQYVGAVSARLRFAYGSSAVDVTTDAGGTWREAFFPGEVIAVAPGVQRDLVALVQSQTQSSRSSILEYVSADGGRHWQISRGL